MSSFVVVKRAQFSLFFPSLAAQMHNVNKWNNCRMNFHEKFVIFPIFIIGFTIRARCIYGASGGGIWSWCAQIKGKRWKLITRISVKYRERMKCDGCSGGGGRQRISNVIHGKRKEKLKIYDEFFIFRCGIFHFYRDAWQCEWRWYQSKCIYRPIVNRISNENQSCRSLSHSSFY